MTEWKKVFVSAVTDELLPFRTAASDALRNMGVDVVVQEKFSTEYGTVRQVLWDKIRPCDAVVCLVGFSFGREPDNRPPGQERRSYTQIEYDIGRELGKPTILLFSTKDVPLPTAGENEEKQQLQQRYRAELMSSDLIQYSFASIFDVHRLIANIEVRPRLPVTTTLKPLPSTAPSLIGRDRALQRLEETWFDPRIHIIQLVAWGGVGKTALVAQWLKDLAKRDWLRAEKVFVWRCLEDVGSVSNVASADDFIAHAFEFFNDTKGVEIRSAFERGERLAELFKQYRSLLVLDGLEALQFPPGSLAGQLKDPALKALLESLASDSRGLCLITTREGVADLDAWRESTAPQWALESLDEEAGAGLLKRAGVSGPDEELRAASTEVDGHALTLELLGLYLVAAYRGDIRKRSFVKLENADRRVAAGRAFQVMKAYEEWLAGSGEDGKHQLDLLRVLGFFDRPADPPCLEALRAEPPIPDLTAGLLQASEEDFNVVVSRLTQAGLVRRVAWEAAPVRGFSEAAAQQARKSQWLGHPDCEQVPQPPSGDALEIHPLVREYFAGRMRTEAPEAWRAGHRRLYERLSRSVPYWPEGLEGLQPLYRAILHGCEAGEHLEACARIYRDRVQRSGYGYGYSITMLGAATAELGAVTCFFETPWKRVHSTFPPPAEAWVLRDAAYTLRSLGRLAEALEPQDSALQLTISRQDWLQAASRSNDLSQLQLLLGRIEDAIRTGWQSVTFAERAADRWRQIVNRTTLAEALGCAGYSEEALKIFAEAEALDGRGTLFSLQGFNYCEQLLVPLGRLVCMRLLALPSRPPPEANVEVVGSLTQLNQRAQRIVHTAEGRGDEALGYLTLSKVSLYSAVLSSQTVPVATQALGEANQSIEMAVNYARESASSEYLAGCLICRATIHGLSGRPEAAENDLRAAWSIASRGPMELHAADIQLCRARLFRDAAVAKDVRQRFEKWGYRRHEGELNDVQAALSA